MRANRLEHFPANELRVRLVSKRALELLKTCSERLALAVAEPPDPERLELQEVPVHFGKLGDGRWKF